MSRFILLGLFASIILNLDKNNEDKPYDNYNLSSYSDSNIDPIILGKSVSSEHFANWKIQNERYKECGLCDEELQAFPTN